MKEITNIIRSRRSVFPKMYNGQNISKEIIEEVLENANWAPTHKLTEPWRFKVIQGNGLKRLSDFLGEHYKRNAGEKFSEMKYNKTIKKPIQSDTIILICMQRDPEERVPEWEEIAAVSCAVQNMWLTCTAHGIGSYWSTTKAIHDISDFIDLEEGEICLGLFFMGKYDPIDLPAKRNSVSDKVKWLTE